MTQIHPEINIGLQYIRNTDEYILKLQLHEQQTHNVIVDDHLQSFYLAIEGLRAGEHEKSIG